MAHIQRAIEWVSGGHVVVWVPQLDGRVEISHIVIATPLQNRWAIDIPCQVEQQVAVANACRKKCIEVFASHAILLVGNASLE